LPLFFSYCLISFQFAANAGSGPLAFFFYTLLARDCFSWAFASARVALSALAPNRQTLSVANAPITVYIAQAGYILSNLPAEPTPHDIIAVDDLRYAAKLIFAQPASL
jgi:hypothetical protein